MSTHPHVISLDDFDRFVLKQDLASSTQGNGKRRRLQLVAMPVLSEVQYEVVVGNDSPVCFEFGQFEKAIEYYNFGPQGGES
jgi:hypothetical protein